MAYSEFLADRVRQRLSKQSVIEKKMMGGLIFMVNEKMCIGVDTDRKSGHDRLMVRVGKSAYENLLKNKGCREIGLKTGLVDIKVCAVDEVWSGLKFVIPLKNRKIGRIDPEINSLLTGKMETLNAI